jgi:hypothetical protein
MTARITQDSAALLAVSDLKGFRAQTQILRLIESAGESKPRLDW